MSEGQAELELAKDKEAIRNGQAHFLLMKIWESVDFTHRGSLGRQGITVVPDGALSFSFPCEKESLTPQEMQKLLEEMMRFFSKSFDVFVHLGEDF